MRSEEHLGASIARQVAQGDLIGARANPDAPQERIEDVSEERMRAITRFYFYGNDSQHSHYRPC